MQNKRDSDVWKRFNRKYALIHSYVQVDMNRLVEQTHIQMSLNVWKVPCHNIHENILTLFEHYDMYIAIWQNIQHQNWY